MPNVSKDKQENKLLKLILTLWRACSGKINGDWSIELVYKMAVVSTKKLIAGGIISDFI